MEQVVHGPFLVTLNAALPLVQNILRDSVGGLLHAPLLLPQTTDCEPKSNRHTAQGTGEQQHQPIHSAPPPALHLYPMRRTVTIRVGLVGSSSIFARRRRM